MNTKQNDTRFAVTVPVKIAPRAVERNALRRRISESLRLLLTEHALSGGRRAVVTAQKYSLTGPEITEALVMLLKKSGILPQ